MPMVGAPGTVAGVALTVLEALPVPAALVAVTEQVYELPFVSPLTTTGLALPLAVVALPAPILHDAV